MTSRSDYTQAVVGACNSVLIELVHILGEVRDHLVLVGGLTPAYLLPEAEESHVGTRDIDLALDFRQIDDAQYKTILEAMMGRGYVQDTKQPFRFWREVETTDGVQKIAVDLMAGEYGGTGASHRTQKVQDVRARKARGIDLVFRDPIVVSVDGELPDGGKDSVTFRIAGIVPFLVTKGMAIDQRLKEKDAYDIYYCIRNYPGGAAALLDEFKPWLGLALVSEGLSKIRAAFATVDHLGPRMVVDFEEVEEVEDREVLQRVAFETVDALLSGLGAHPLEWP